MVAPGDSPMPSVTPARKLQSADFLRGARKPRCGSPLQGWWRETPLLQQ